MNIKQTVHQATIAKWLPLFQEQKASGLTVKDWCSQTGYSQHQYYYWKRLAKEAYVENMLPQSFEVPTSDPIPSPDTSLDLYNLCESSDNLPKDTCKSKPDQGNISVFVNDTRIEVTPQSADDFIARVIKAVRYA